MYVEWSEIPGVYDIRAQVSWQRDLLLDENLFDPVADSLRWFAYDQRVLVPADSITGTGTMATRIHFHLPVIRGDSLYVRAVVRAVSEDGSVTPWTDGGIQVMYAPFQALQPTTVTVGLLPADDPVIQSWMIR
jgi:hypothetical protein